MGEQDANKPVGPKTQMPTSAWIVIIFLVAIVTGLVVWKKGANNQPAVPGSKTEAVNDKQQAAPVGGSTTPAAVSTAPAAAQADAKDSPKAVATPINFDQELKDMDKATNSVSENDFSEDDLSDANLGL